MSIIYFRTRSKDQSGDLYLGSGRRLAIPRRVLEIISVVISKSKPYFRGSIRELLYENRVLTLSPLDEIGWLKKEKIRSLLISEGLCAWQKYRRTSTRVHTDLCVGSH